MAELVTFFMVIVVMLAGAGAVEVGRAVKAFFVRRDWWPVTEGGIRR
jgi:hypothetical protein